MWDELPLYLALGRMAFRRYLAYRTANLAGLVTNAFFGYLRAAVFIAVFASAGGQTSIASYDVQAAVTYTWATQALIMVVSLWGWWDVEVTIRSGDVVTDLARPFSYLGYWLARDLGRAAYFVLFRGLPSLLMGQLTLPGGLRWPEQPESWLALPVSLVLAVVVSFAWRFVLNLSAFWTTDARGLGALSGGLVLFLGGFVVPIRFFPEWAQPVLLALPFASIIEVPCDILAGRLSGTDMLAALAGQAVWAVALLFAAQCVVSQATRRVSVQGG
jgi:ABC-2 type transport system permease protein